MTLQEAIRNAGLKVVPQNTTVDIAVTIVGGKYQFSAGTWHGRKFLSVMTDAESGEFTAPSAKDATWLSSEAVRAGLNVTLSGKNLYAAEI